MKTILIVNPVSARLKQGAGWAQIRQALAAENFPYDAVFTERRGHALELARQALAGGFGLIAAVGGDGTLNEVVNGMIGADGRPVNPEAVLGLISTGTGCDFARTAGIPRDLTAAAAQLARARGARSFDIGEITFRLNGQDADTHRYFANVAGMGFDAEVIERTEIGGKRGGGTIPYLTTLLTTISAYRNKDVSLRIDDQTIAGRMNSVVICNGKYFGGGMEIAPHAALDDGLFHITTLGDFGTIEVMLNTPRLYNGTILSHPKVTEYRGKVLTVESRQRMMIEADGEMIAPGPATFRIHPALLQLRA